MSLAKSFRKFKTPGYGVCGGRDRSCVFENMDPMDKLFYQHDHDMYAAELLPTEDERAEAEEAGDDKLCAGLRALTDKDMKKIPLFVSDWPFFKRAYAHIYRKAAIKAFQ